MLLYYTLMDSPEDREKFTILYGCYRDQMLRRAYQILHNQADAEDAVHEAFLTVAKNISKISEPKCHKTRNYLVTIVESKAIDLYRKYQRCGCEPLKESMPAPETELPEDGLAKCILRLPENYRTLVYLKYEQGYNNREIAAILEMRESAVRKMDQRAKERLAELCREEGVEI